MAATKQQFFALLETGREDDSWDFKEDIKLKPNESFYETLKDILAFSNSGGGYLLLGVKDGTLELVGVKAKIDEAALASKIESTLGYTLKFSLFYFNHKEDGKDIDLGIIYIHEGEKIHVSSKPLTGQKNVIIQSSIAYVRRNTRSIPATATDYERLAEKVNKQGEYEFKDWDLKILERNRNFSNDLGRRLYTYLSGDFFFNSNEFSHKIHEIYTYQTKYNKLEFARLIGIENHKIDDYFEGKAFPTLEHILRATSIFNLPPDYFFKPTLYGQFPIWHNPLISHSVLEKVKVKREIFNLNKGVFFRTVLLELGKAINTFINWLKSQRPKQYDNEFERMLASRPSDYLYNYVEDLTDKELEEFKEHLKHQHYKILEKFDSEDNERFLMDDERVINTLIQLGDELICRIINESIKEIKVLDKEEVEVRFHFIDEIINKERIGRQYSLDTLSLELVQPSK
ncbi:ATP-binding protein [Bacillus toyonensis]|uniref:AlbA family DNA-binding domain-containing protein n=1 Tax=Bacillus toyonensis TaxID=155322 RepID=UPI000BF221A4|nr:ATP-binding protein [Bacillus toyonensis]PEN35713.1 ATP-binding protein [Bacillus toyonensis]PEO05446.1 ATP-binding protein [Bacillus toyonensis]QWH46764.1 ATP-binding protein [Bacillus toyonensis]